MAFYEIASERRTLHGALLPHRALKMPA